MSPSQHHRPKPAPIVRANYAQQPSLAQNRVRTPGSPTLRILVSCLARAGWHTPETTHRLPSDPTAS